ncbi:hypothetical protein [Nonomuraea rhodomycinica]|uniref:WxL domain surface cell wall-binding n=1 Tax=Nonomuraea rhodomycinica TaxID=1712872 RepID=A0A7Y6MAD3_9ACTN|nr:hypothetical protein [Nonomuraea rhodomycinica]NUW39349.1 hypothetical protein [Nonomuraea rhodomycinica]
MRKAAAVIHALMIPVALAHGPAVPGAHADVSTAVHATVAARAFPLEIIVPNTADLGTGSRGGTLSASLGTVTVNDTRSGNRTWTATVSATDFTTGSGSGLETITKANIAYWSGPVTSQTGTGTRTPGQATAAQRVALTVPVVAFRATKGPTNTSTSWQPTIVVSVPQGAISGFYTGTITHSVA